MCYGIIINFFGLLGDLGWFCCGRTLRCTTSLEFDSDRTEGKYESLMAQTMGTLYSYSALSASHDHVHIYCALLF